MHYHQRRPPPNMPSLPKWLGFFLAGFFAVAFVPHLYESSKAYVLHKVFSGYNVYTAELLTEIYGIFLYPLMFVVMMVAFQEISKFVLVWFYNRLF